MANRGASWDPLVHTIADLKEAGCAKLPKEHSGKQFQYSLELFRTISWLTMVIPCSRLLQWRCNGSCYIER